MGRGSANPVVLSVVSNGERVTRKWKIKINMIPCNNLDMGRVARDSLDIGNLASPISRH